MAERKQKSYVKEKTRANLTQLSASPITHILLINLLNERYKVKRDSREFFAY